MVRGEYEARWKGKTAAVISVENAEPAYITYRPTYLLTEFCLLLYMGLTMTGDKYHC
jgi:hypothetical protein